MTKRDPHPDNDIIERAAELDTPSQQGSSGGNVNRDVGKRAELNRALGTLEGNEVEREVGSDNPADDARKGPKSREHLVGGGSSPSR